MKKMFFKSLLLTGVVIATLSSCMSLNNSMREPNIIVNFNKNDFSLSDQVTATAKSTKILGIDFERLFTRKTGFVKGSASSGLSLASIPVVGNLAKDITSNYSLYELMVGNPGYDVVFYPQYETKVFKPIGIGFIMKITTVKTTARLGKLTK
jgi:hypothetical protein